MSQLEDLVRPVNVLICLNPKSMRTQPELPQRNRKSVHPLAESEMELNNKPNPQIHEVLDIEDDL